MSDKKNSTTATASPPPVAMTSRPQEHPVRQRRGPDAELQAMAKIDQIVGGLDCVVQIRILDWLSSRVRSRIHAAEAKDAAGEAGFGGLAAEDLEGT